MTLSITDSKIGYLDVESINQATSTIQQVLLQYIRVLILFLPRKAK